MTKKFTFFFYEEKKKKIYKKIMQPAMGFWMHTGDGSPVIFWNICAIDP